jgi:hypothetical protein
MVRPMSGVNPKTGKPGPAPASARSGDKAQARQRINVEVRTGHRPHPNTLSCADCGDVWSAGKLRHEYDHHLGYEAEHHLDVEAVCIPCHVKRDSRKAAQEACIRGHPFDSANTIIKPNGTRACRECRRAHDRRRGRDADYWKTYRAERKARNG